MPPIVKEEEEKKDSGVRKIALIGGISPEHTLVYTEGKPIVLPHIKGYAPGQYVLVEPQSGFFEKVMTDLQLPCNEMIVKEVLDDSTVRAELQGNGVLLIKDRKLKLEEGDHVAVDLQTPVILRKLPKPQVKETKDVPNVPWEGIIGQSEAVLTLKEIGEGFTHGKIAEFYGRRLPRGLMLWGPPGCGKTLLAKALATALGSEGFFTMRGPEILSKWVGNSEAACREFFETGSAYHRKTGKKAVLFIDEADALLGKRGSEHHSVITDTLVPQFLTLMDGMTENSSIVILATNRPDQLDSAVVREGRIDKKIQVKRPTPSVAVEILSHYFSKRPITDSCEKLASLAVQILSGAQLQKLGPTTILTAAHYLSGALCEMLVEESATQAYQRNIRERSGSVKGITQEDVNNATRSIASGLANLDHQNVIYEHGLRG